MPARTVAPLGILFATLSLPLLAQPAMLPDPALVPDATLLPLKPHRYADVVLEGDLVTGSLDLTIPPALVGSRADLYLAALVTDDAGEHAYVRTAGGWEPWSGRPADLVPLRTATLSALEQLDIANGEPLAAGTYRLVGGYRLPGGTLRYMPQALEFDVHGPRSQTLVRFQSDADLEAYLKDALRDAGDPAKSLRFSPGLLATTGAEVDVAASRVSGTNLQQAGVDEGDTVKARGNKLYFLSTCDAHPCLQLHTIDPASATSTPVSSHVFPDNAAPSSMYLVERSGGDQLVTLSSQGDPGNWFRIWGWGEGKTELQFLQASAAGQWSRQESLNIDGALVASRRIGDTLYVVTRYTPQPEGYIPYPLDKQAEAGNAATLAALDLPALLPRVETSRDELMALVRSRNCYLPGNAADGGYDPSIITITSIPLATPTAFQSTCYLGGSETLYMSTDALYLATTAWEYGLAGTNRSLYRPDHTTSVHKFALQAGGVEYRGSGAVQGHLGWVDDKKSFRMGQQGDYLHVVTSVGDTWDGSASTTLNVLRDVDGKLDTVTSIKGIGKPGEQLYAARFVGDRAYLVTFRLTDPLYVIDLANPANPRIAGELEIDGYSDYLHPVSDTLLLGIGKDAVPDEGSSDLGGRGAWYQGVKVALFDVANPARPVEVDSMVLGKRGTESDVLWDHHAFSFLPAQGSEPARFAIPVRLHDRLPPWTTQDPARPNFWYDYTHTGLYSFQVGPSGISLAGKLIAEVASARPPADLPEPRLVAGTSILLPGPLVPWYGDRSVLVDDAVYYIHDGKVLGSFWGQSR